MTWWRHSSKYTHRGTHTDQSKWSYGFDICFDFTWLSQLWTRLTFFCIFCIVRVFVCVVVMFDSICLTFLLFYCRRPSRQNVRLRLRFVRINEHWTIECTNLHDNFPLPFHLLRSSSHFCSIFSVYFSRKKKLLGVLSDSAQRVISLPFGCCLFSLLVLLSFISVISFSILFHLHS